MSALVDEIISLFFSWSIIHPAFAKIHFQDWMFDWDSCFLVLVVPPSRGGVFLVHFAPCGFNKISPYL